MARMQQENGAVEEVQSLERKLLGWGITLLLGIVGSTLTFGVWVGGIDERVDQNKQNIMINHSKIEMLVSSQNDIKVQLARIEAILIEIQKQL